jgi:predicted dehydrogenase
MSHAVDLVHLWTDESYPESAMATGGVFVWKDRRQTPDTCLASFTYPKGFLYTYQTTFGNSYRSFGRIQGRDGTITSTGCEGGYLYSISEEGGRRESDEDAQPEFTKLPVEAPANDHEKLLQVPGAPHPSSHGPNDDDVQHLLNWLHAMQDRRDPNATVDHGFSHAIACIMAAQSYWSGKKVYWNPKLEEIVDLPV